MFLPGSYRSQQHKIIILKIPFLMSVNTMSYTLCISASCPSCEKIIGLLQDMKVKVNIKDVQLEPNCDVSIIPALFKGNKLIAYGKDIVFYFRKHKKNREAS